MKYLRQISPALLPALMGLVVGTMPTKAIAQEQRFSFERLKSIQYKPTVNTIKTDEYGRIWFGTMGRGAFCYDGYNYFRYLSNGEESRAISNDRVFTVLPDRRQRVWFGTLNGLNYLDRHSNRIHTFKSFKDSVRQFQAIFEDRSGTIWLGSNRSMLRFDESTQAMQLVPSKTPGFITGRTYTFLEDTHGTLWAGRSNGLFRFAPDRSYYEQITLEVPERKNKSLVIRAMLEDSRGTLWIGTEQGLFAYDRFSGKLMRPPLPDSLAFHPVSAILEYTDGTIWLGYQWEGLLRWDVRKGGFQAFQHNPLDPSSLPNNAITALETDKFGNLWVGTAIDVARINLSQNALSLWPLDPHEPNARTNAMFRMAEDKLGGIIAGSSTALWYLGKLGAQPIPILVDGDRITAYDFYTDHDSNVWAAIKGKVYIWNPQKRRFDWFRTPPLPGSVLNVIVDLQDPNILWIGTQKGLSRFDRRSGTVKSFTQFSPPPFDQFVRNLADDGQGSIWLDIPNFLAKFDKKTFKTYIFNSDSLAPHQLANDEINDIKRAPNGWIWVTTSGGITRIDPKTGYFYNLKGKNTLPENLVTTVLFDQAGNTWAVQPSNITCLDLAGQIVRSYNITSILQTTSWARGKTQLSDGRVLFTTINGIALFDPSKILENQSVSSILLTRFETSNLEKNRQISPEFLRHIQLANAENNITLEWAGIQTARPGELQYECKLERKGEKEDWEQKGETRQVVYANLDPGAYVFRVRVVGQSQPELVLEIAIAPAWWQATYFKMLLAVLFITAAYLFWRNRERHRELLQQKELAEQNARYKTRFLANMSHEIRTPMNAILGLSRLLTESKLPPKQSEYAEAIRQSSENLLVIVNDVLDQVKIESGKFTFQHNPFDLALIVQHLQNTLGFKAAEKGLIFDIHIDPDTPHQLVGDSVRLNQVLTNLLGNAIKFTEKGNVRLEIGIHSAHPNPGLTYLFFRISDTGIGIPPEQIVRVFESFQQADEAVSAHYGGTGLGLSITKDLVEQQGGAISIKSFVGKGTDVYCYLPFAMNNTPKAAEQLVESPNASLFENLHILLVEDTFFNQMLAIELLKSRIPGVDIEVAENGLVALEKIETAPPFDLVLMDIKMPVMDGLEATRRLRGMAKGATLPVIALTANAVQAELEKCREVGMNAWVTKPIDTAELFKTIYQVLHHDSNGVESPLDKKTE